MKKINTRNLVNIAVLSAISSVLFLFEISIFPPLAFDFSDLPVMLAGVSLGIVPGILVAIIKNILHLLLINSGFIGEVANVIYALIVMLPVALYMPKKVQHIVVYFVLLVVVSSLIMCTFNYFFLLPIYGITAMSDKLAFIYANAIPFNLVKGAIIYGLFYIIHRFMDRMPL